MKGLLCVICNSTSVLSATFTTQTQQKCQRLKASPQYIAIANSTE